MFILVVTYTAPAEQVQAAMAAHRDWVDAQFDQGLFVLSGPKAEGGGGAILAHGIERSALETILNDDPFVRSGVAQYQVVEMKPRRGDSRLAFLME